MKPTKKTVFECYLVVEGSGEFPYDMLRYDAAFPAEEYDSKQLGDRDDKRRVLLCRRGVNDKPASIERWRSFGWRVIHADVELYDARRVQNSEAPGCWEHAPLPSGRR